MCVSGLVHQEVRCRLLSKLSALDELRDEADEARRQMDRQTEERQTEELEKQLLTLDTTDQQHVSSGLRLWGGETGTEPVPP